MIEMSKIDKPLVRLILKRVEQMVSIGNAREHQSKSYSGEKRVIRNNIR